MLTSFMLRAGGTMPITQTRWYALARVRLLVWKGVTLQVEESIIQQTWWTIKRGIVRQLLDQTREVVNAD